MATLRKKIKAHGSTSCLSPRPENIREFDLKDEKGVTVLATVVVRVARRPSFAQEASHPYNPPAIEATLINRILSSYSCGSRRTFNTDLMHAANLFDKVVPISLLVILMWAPKSLKWFCTKTVLLSWGHTYTTSHFLKFGSVSEIREGFWILTGF